MGETQWFAAHACVLTDQKGLGDLDHVVTALAQRRQLQGDDVQAVIEVFAKLAGLGPVSYTHLSTPSNPAISQFLHMTSFPCLEWTFSLSCAGLAHMS